MASTRAVLLFGLATHAFVSDWMSAFCTRVGKLTDALCSYLLGVSSEWVFLSGVSLPLPASQYKNLDRHIPTRHTIKWAYNSATQMLRMNPREQQRVFAHFTPDWLSASIEINGTEYVIDNWIQDFVYEQTTLDWFSPYVLATCWSIHSKVWFTPTDDVNLHVITNSGDRISFSLADRDADEEWVDVLVQGEGEEVNEVVGEEEDDGEDGEGEDEEDGDDESDEDEEDVEEQSTAAEEEQPAAVEELPAAAETQPATVEELPAANGDTRPQPTATEDMLLPVSDIDTPPRNASEIEGSALGADLDEID